MKKIPLLLILILSISIQLKAQSTTSLPAGTTGVTPAFRVIGSDSLRNVWAALGTGYNQIFTATQVKKYFKLGNDSTGAKGFVTQFALNDSIKNKLTKISGQDFTGLGITGNPIRFATDTPGTGNFIVRATNGYLRYDNTHYYSAPDTLTGGDIAKYVANHGSTKNIYTADGNLSSNRTINGNGHNITFNMLHGRSLGGAFLQIDSLNGILMGGFDIVDFAGGSIQLDSAATYIEYGGNSSSYEATMLDNFMHVGQNSPGSQEFAWGTARLNPKGIEIRDQIDSVGLRYAESATYKYMGRDTLGIPNIGWVQRWVSAHGGGTSLSGTGYVKMSGSTPSYSSSIPTTDISGLNTGNVSESGNLYFTNTRAIAAPLTGYTSGAGTVSSTDNILQAIQKLNGNISANTSSISSNTTAIAGKAGLTANTFTNQQTISFNSTSVSPLFGGETGVQLVGNNTSDLVVEGRPYGGHFIVEAVRYNGTASAPTAILLNDELGAIPAFNGYDGSTTPGEASAAIQGIASENWNSTSHGTQMRVNVTPNGSTTLTASVLFANDLSTQIKGNAVVGQFMTPNIMSYPSYDGILGVIGTNNSAARGVLWVGADNNVTSGTVGESDYVAASNTSGYQIARTYATLVGSTTNNLGATMVFQNKKDGGSLTTFLSADQNQIITIPSLTASKLVFTDASQRLTSTGIGSSSQFIMGDGSLNSTTYLSSTSAQTVTGQWVYSLTDTHSSGNNFGTEINHTVNQTSTAGFTDLLVNRINTAAGSGAQRLLDLQVGGTSEYNVSTSGNTIQQGSATATAFLSTIGFNFYNGSAGGIASTTNNAFQFEGSTTDYIRVGVYGSGSSTLSSGASYSAFQVGISPLTTFTSGTHPWIVQSEINSFGVVTSGGATVTNSAILKLSGAATFATNNYLIYGAAGNSLLGNTIRTLAVPFSQLPSSPVEGMIESVNDSTTNTWGATITGGGSNHVLAYYDGTNWTVMGM